MHPNNNPNHPDYAPERARDVLGPSVRIEHRSGFAHRDNIEGRNTEDLNYLPDDDGSESVSSVEDAEILDRYRTQ